MELPICSHVSRFRLFGPDLIFWAYYGLFFSSSKQIYLQNLPNDLAMVDIANGREPLTSKI